MRRVVFNQKGGVGKSSITVNLAAISASRGKRTLVIDLDSQVILASICWVTKPRIISISPY